MLTWVSRNYFANTRNKLKYLFCYFFHFKKGNCLPFSCSSLLQILIQDLLFQKSCDRKLSISKQNSKDLLMFLDSNCSAKVQISPHTTMVLAWEPSVAQGSQSQSHHLPAHCRKLRFIYFSRKIRPTHFRISNLAKNIPVFLQSSSIKILGKLVQGFMSYDRTKKLTDRQTEITTL